jgi:hypothetical protein
MKCDPGLRAAVEAAVLVEITRSGPEGFSRADLVKRFIDRGASRATLFSWVGAVLASDKPARAIEKRVATAAKRRARKEPDPGAAAARDVVAELPPIVSLGPALTPDAPDSAIPFMRRLQECFAAADQLLKHARTAEGDVRNARLIVVASEHARKTLETAARIQAGLLELGQTEKFHQAVFDVLKEVDPTVAEKVLIRLRQVNATWGVS